MKTRVSVAHSLERHAFIPTVIDATMSQRRLWPSVERRVASPSLMPENVSQSVTSTDIDPLQSQTGKKVRCLAPLPSWLEHQRMSTVNLMPCLC